MLVLFILLYLGEWTEAGSALPEGRAGQAEASREAHAGTAYAAPASGDNPATAAGGASDTRQREHDATDHGKEESDFGEYAEQAFKTFKDKMETGAKTLLKAAPALKSLWDKLSGNGNAETTAQDDATIGGNTPGKAAGGSSEARKGIGSRRAESGGKGARSGGARGAGRGAKGGAAGAAKGVKGAAKGAAGGVKRGARQAAKGGGAGKAAKVFG
jgi:hypothetical protein